MKPESQPLVSVLTPVYNGEKYLSECIESVLEQTYLNWEYIIVNNRSTDRTSEIARAYASKDKRIRVHTNTEFVDFAANENIAFQQIALESKYCKMVHADDWLSPGQLQQGLDTLTKSGADFVFGDLLYYHDGHLCYRIRGDANYTQRIVHVMPALNHPTIIMRRESCNGSLR